MATNPLRDPGSPAWQIISNILTAVGVIVAIIALPDSTRAVGVVTGVLGLGACIIFAARLGRVRATTTSTQEVKPSINSAEVPTHSSPQSVNSSVISNPPSHETDSSQASNLQHARDTTTIVRSYLHYALSMNFVLLVMIGIYFSLFGNLNHWASIVFLVLILSFLISLTSLIRKISQAITRNIVKARVIFAYAFAIFVVLVVMISLSNKSFSTEPLWIEGIAFTSDLALVGDIIVIIVTAIVAGSKAVRGSSHK